MKQTSQKYGNVIKLTFFESIANVLKPSGFSMNEVKRVAVP